MKRILEMSWSLQKYFFKLLDEKLENVNVYSSVPQNVPLPFVVINNFISKDWSCKTFNGRQIFNHIQILDEGGSDQQIYEIAEITRASIERNNFHIDGFEVVNVKVIESKMEVNKSGTSKLMLKIKTNVKEVSRDKGNTKI